MIDPYSKANFIYKGSSMYNVLFKIDAIVAKKTGKEIFSGMQESNYGWELYFQEEGSKNYFVLTFSDQFCKEIENSDACLNYFAKDIINKING